MSTQYLLDPWFVELKPTDADTERFNRLNALKRVVELGQRYGLSPVRFIDQSFLNSFHDKFRNYQRNDGSAIGRIIGNLVMQEQHDHEATISDTPCPELPPNWRKALDHCGSADTSPHWRKPIIVISEVRSGVWPQIAEIEFKASNNMQIRRRNLVHIENYDQHVYCEPDLDPWRLGAVGPLIDQNSGEAVHERHSMRQRLPRPIHLLPLNLTYDQIVQILRNHMEWSCGQEGKAYYIPPQGWDPRTISQDEWRRKKVFHKRREPHGDRWGYVDREDRIWLWDKKHNIHWDVQIPSGKHINVSPDGYVLDSLPHFSE